MKKVSFHSWFARKPDVKGFKISAEKAKELMESGGPFVLADVRMPNEYASGHIRGSISVPLPEITELAINMLPDKQTPVLVYCQSGRRSARAAAILD
ncbi:MAG: rhodanese-like domain-containing protein, partial [Eubacteriales bacterium]